jgi:fibronectin-binding autotransporter adhesin
MKLRHRSYLGSLLLCISMIESAQSATVYWDGSSGNWNDLTKWSTDLAGLIDPTAAPLATVSDTLIFNTTPGAASNSTVFLNGNRGTSAILATLNFNATGATTILGGVSGTAANNDLFTAGITVNSGSGAVTIGDTASTPTAQVNLKAGSVSFTNNSTSLLTLANGLNSFGSGSITTFTFAGSGNILSSGVIGNGTGTNVVAISKTGAGILTLSGNNTFTGGVTIGSGANGGIKITNSNSLGTHATGKTINFTGGTNGVALLDMDPGAGGAITLSNKINFLISSNTTTGSGIVSRTGTNVIQGLITMQTGLASTAISSSAGSTLTISGVVSANATTRQLHLGGASTNANTISGNMNGSAGFSNFAVIKNDAGVWVLSGDNSYTGMTTVNGGTLRLNSNTAIGGGGGLTLNTNGVAIDNTSGGTVTLANAGTLTIGNNFSFGGSNVMNFASTNQSNDLTLTMNGTASLGLGNYTNTKAGDVILNVANANGTVNIDNVALSNSATSRQLYMLNNSAANGRISISGSISDGGTATASSVRVGNNANTTTGSVTLSGNNTFGGGVRLDAGTLNINSSTALGATAGTFTINGGTINNNSGGAIVNANNNAQAWNGDFTFTGTNNLDLGSGAVSMGGTRTVTVSAGTLTVGGAISGSTFQLRKTGGGTLTLTGASTYTGNTLISAGLLHLNHDPADTLPAIKGNVSLSTSASGNRPVLYLGNNNQLESTASITASLTGSTSNFTDFVLAGRSQTIASYSTTGRPTATARSFIENGFLAGDSGNGVLTINNSSTVTLGGGITADQLEIRNNNGTGGGTLALVKDGVGTMILNLYAASYTGGFTLKNGLVQIAGTAFADTGTVATSTPLIFEGGTLSSNGATARSIGAGNTVSLAGDLILGDATNNGALSFAGAATLTGNRQLTIASGVTFSGGIGQDVAGRSLTKAGDGTLTLSGTSAYSGGTTVKAGTLVLGANAAAAGSGGIFLGDSSGSSNATLQVSNNISFANAITVQGAGGTKSIISASSGATPTFTGGLSLNDHLILNNNAASSNLQFTTNNVSLNGNTLTVNSNGTNAGTVSFASTTAITGTSASAINFGGSSSAAGKFRLSAANSFAGTATLNASTGGGALALELNHVNALQNATLDTGASGNQAVTFVVGGTNSYAIGALQGSDALEIGGNTIRVGAKAVNTSFNGIISGSGGGLTKTGSSSLTLSGVNSYTGETVVEAGKLVISSTGSTAAGSAVTVSNAGSELVVDGTLGGTLFINSGAMLSGSGTIGGSTTIAGLHNPGNSPGVQTFNSDLSYQGGSTITWELGGNTTSQSVPAIFDQMIVGGNLSFAATTTVNLLFNTVGSTVTWGDALWDSNQSWTIFDVAGTTSGLENVNLTTSNWADSTGALFDTVRSNGFFSLSLSGQDVMLNYTAVPETSVSLLGGLSALLLLRRKRR